MLCLRGLGLERGHFRLDSTWLSTHTARQRESGASCACDAYSMESSGLAAFSDRKRRPINLRLCKIHIVTLPRFVALKPLASREKYGICYLGVIPTLTICTPAAVNPKTWILSRVSQKVVQATDYMHRGFIGDLELD